MFKGCNLSLVISCDVSIRVFIMISDIALDLQPQPAGENGFPTTLCWGKWISNYSLLGKMRLQRYQKSAEQHIKKKTIDYIFFLNETFPKDICI